MSMDWNHFSPWMLGAEIDKGVLFMMAMLAGMLGYELFDRVAGTAGR